VGRKQSRSEPNALKKLLFQGVAALLVGAALVALPWLVPPSSLAEAVAGRAGIPGAIALALGVLLVAVYAFLRTRRKPKGGAQADSTSWAPPESLMRNDPGFADAYVPRSAVRTRRVGAAPAAGERRQSAGWTHQVLDEIGGRRFEAVCERLFAQGGFETRVQSLGGEAGIVLGLQSRNSPGAAAVVQCTHSRKQVGTQELDEFFGLMAERKFKRGTFVTNATFTPEAQQFAKAHGINAMDRHRLLELIAKRTPQQQQLLLEIATQRA
jgi:restriction system protein